MKKSKINFSSKINKSFKPSSRKWLERQMKDQYAQKIVGGSTNYFSRAAFKLLEMEKKHKVLKNVNVAVDLGAAPGNTN